MSLELNNGGDDPTEIYLPPPARGVQLAVTARAIPRGAEETLCHYLKLPSDADIDVNRIQIAVSGGSHHIHLYRAYDSAVDIADGFEECNRAVDFDQWALVVATQLRRTDWELPSGVAFHLRAGEQLLVQTHFVNVGSLETMGEGRVLMNLNAADDGTVEQHAGALFGQDRDVFVPRRSTTTKAAECVFPNPITLMAQTGHYHFRGRRFSTYRWDDGVRGEEIYHHAGYDDPLFEVYDPLASPAFAAGQGLLAVGVLLGESGRRRLRVRPVHRHQRALQPVRVLLPPNEFISCIAEDGVSTTTVRRGE